MSENKKLFPPAIAVESVSAAVAKAKEVGIAIMFYVNCKNKYSLFFLSCYFFASKDPEKSGSSKMVLL